METHGLVSELSEHSSHPSNQRGNNQLAKFTHVGSGSERESSALFLQVLVAADYYTTNKTLMRSVPPVYVDIILDPFIFNVLPQSLVPTVGYIIIIAMLSWFIAHRISSWLRNVATEPNQKKDQ